MSRYKDKLFCDRCTSPIKAGRRVKYILNLQVCASLFSPHEPDPILCLTCAEGLVKVIEGYLSNHATMSGW